MGARGFKPIRFVGIYKILAKVLEEYVGKLLSNIYNVFIKGRYQILNFMNVWIVH
jgi:hypothetical protein